MFSQLAKGQLKPKVTIDQERMDCSQFLVLAIRFVPNAYPHYRWFCYSTLKGYFEVRLLVLPINIDPNGIAYNKGNFAVSFIVLPLKIVPNGIAYYKCYFAVSF